MTQLVRDVMTPSVVAVEPDAPVVEAARLMRAHDLGGVLVTRDGALVGVVTDRDITLRAVADGTDPLTVTCREVCTANPVCVGPDEEVPAAVRLMRGHAVRRLPVVEDGWPVGVVSLGDLAREQDPGSALADISRAAPTAWYAPGMAGPDGAAR